MSDSSINTRTHSEPHGLEQQANRDEAFVVTHPWIRHYEQGVPAHIDIPDQPLTWLLAHTASRYPGRTALIYYGTRLSYTQLVHHAHRFATALGRLGVHKGERVAIVHPETGEPVPIGEVGELVVRGPNMMQGYWNCTEETSQTFRNGWMRTGDLGKMDADGYFSVQPPLSGGGAALQYIASHKPVYLIELVSFVGLSLPAMVVFLALSVALKHLNKSYAALSASLGKSVLEGV